MELTANKKEIYRWNVGRLCSFCHLKIEIFSGCDLNSPALPPSSIVHVSCSAWLRQFKFETASEWGQRALEIFWMKFNIYLSTGRLCLLIWERRRAILAIDRVSFGRIDWRVLLRIHKLWARYTGTLFGLVLLCCFFFFLSFLPLCWPENSRELSAAYPHLLVLCVYVSGLRARWVMAST